MPSTTAATTRTPSAIPPASSRLRRTQAAPRFVSVWNSSGRRSIFRRILIRRAVSGMRRRTALHLVLVSLGRPLLDEFGPTDPSEDLSELPLSRHHHLYHDRVLECLCS